MKATSRRPNTNNNNRGGAAGGGGLRGGNVPNPNAVPHAVMANLLAALGPAQAQQIAALHLQAAAAGLRPAGVGGVGAAAAGGVGPLPLGGGGGTAAAATSTPPNGATASGMALVPQHLQDDETFMALLHEGVVDVEGLFGGGAGAGGPAPPPA